MFKKSVANVIEYTTVGVIWGHAGVKVATNPWRVKRHNISDFAGDLAWRERGLYGIAARAIVALDPNHCVES